MLIAYIFQERTIPLTTPVEIWAVNIICFSFNFCIRTHIHNYTVQMLGWYVNRIVLPVPHSLPSTPISATVLAIHSHPAALQAAEKATRPHNPECVLMQVCTSLFLVLWPIMLPPALDTYMLTAWQNMMVGPSQLHHVTTTEIKKRLNLFQSKCRVHSVFYLHLHCLYDIFVSQLKVEKLNHMLCDH